MPINQKNKDIRTSLAERHQSIVDHNVTYKSALLKSVKETVELQADQIRQNFRDSKRLVKYISEEMVKNRNGELCQRIRELNLNKLSGSVTAHPTLLQMGSNRIHAGTLFVESVRTGGDWDYKSKPHFKSFGTTHIGSIILPIDTWGNIHFGYIGVQCGFAPVELRAGAGLYQVKERTVTEGYVRRVISQGPSGFDDPRDQTCINIGTDLAKRLPNGTAEEIASELYQQIRKHELNLHTDEKMKTNMQIRNTPN